MGEPRGAQPASARWARPGATALHDGRLTRIEPISLAEDEAPSRPHRMVPWATPRRMDWLSPCQPLLQPAWRANLAQQRTLDFVAT